MPIEPINTSGFARNPLGIEAILERGTSAFGGIIRDMIQVGRDQANNQVGQERDFLAEQRREINLNQRRGENVLAQQNADRRFTEDTRQFDAKFGQGQSQFAQNIEQSNLDRVVRTEGQDIQRAQGEANIGLRKDELNQRGEDLTFRRTQAAEEKTQRDEVQRVNLETAKVRLADAKSEPEKAAAKQAYEAAKTGALAHMDELITSGDKEAAKRYFNSTIEAYDFDPGTKSRLAKQAGIDTTGTKEEGPLVNEAETMTDEQLETEFRAMERAVAGGTPEQAGTQVDKLDQKAALRLAAIRTERERRAKAKEGNRFLNRYK